MEANETHSGRYASNSAMNRVFDILSSEGIISRVRGKREWIRPGLVASLGRMRRRQERFNDLVRRTINEVQDIRRRLK